jgi:hypothetical protein
MLGSDRRPPGVRSSILTHADEEPATLRIGLTSQVDADEYVEADTAG